MNETIAPTKIFLSYSSKDGGWVRQFAAGLREEGVDHWFDLEALRPGTAWQDELAEALRTSETLIVVLTPNNALSPWTLFELGAAIGDHKRIIPVIPEEFDLRDIPDLIRPYKFLIEPSPQEAAKRVAQILSENA